MDKNKKEVDLEAVPQARPDARHYMGEQAMLEARGVKYLQVIISKERGSRDTYTVWINTENGCILRAQQVEQIDIKDERDD